MDYAAIDNFMQATGLAIDPAFEHLHFLTEPIAPPDARRRILGLYYPDGNPDLPTSTIILPADCTEGTLLHELGHRHGDYYHGDITEGYAERYREQQMGRFETRFPGSYARVQNISQEMSPRSPAAAMSDWTVDNFKFNAVPATAKYGDNINIKLGFSANDILANFPDAWQIALVVFTDAPDSTFHIRQYGSSMYGHPVAYSPTIAVNMGTTDLAWYVGKMPKQNIQLSVLLYANHSEQPTFTWPQSASGKDNWDLVGSIYTEILLDTSTPGGQPPPGTVPPPAGFKLYQQGQTDRAGTYAGKAQTAVFSFATGPEQLDFLGSLNQLLTACENAIAQKSPGDHLLQLVLYRDASPLIHTNYELQLTATDITGNDLPWNLIISVALLALLAWLVINPVLDKVTDLFWGPKGPGGKRPGPLSNPLVWAAGIAGVVVLAAIVKNTSVKGAVTGARNP